jgi:hypothetical protein
MAVEKSGQGFTLSIQVQAKIKIQALEVPRTQAGQEKAIKIEGTDILTAFS